MNDARRAALSALIDHAPLFPPASLPVGEALAEDRRARADEHAWLRACREADVPFKATAGLHHPLAAEGRQGFLNVLAACSFFEPVADLLELGIL